MIAEFDDSRPIGDAPADLSAGERVLWQGAPDWWSFALRGLRVREVSAYFLAIMAWRFGSELAAGAGASAGAISAGWALALGLPVIGFLLLYARLVGRCTRYTVTTRRVVLRIGVTLPMTVTIPVGLVGSLDLRRHPDGTGDIVLAVLPDQRLSYAVLWPHVRPWRLGRPEAAMRSVADAEAVAGALARMFARQAGQAEPVVSRAAAGRRAAAEVEHGSLASAAG